MTFVIMKPQYPVNGHPSSIHTRTLQRWPWKRACIKPAPSLSICNSQQHDEQFVSHFPSVNQSVAAIIFGDGSESRLLYPLTKRRSEGAIPIAANYRLIDVVVSNCINSNINKIYAFTQFNSTSLNSHLSRAYSAVGLGKDGFVEVIAAYQSPDDNDWFQGNADAVRRCLWVLEEHPVSEFLILPGHHLYKMDYQRLIRTHRTSNADITIVVSNAVKDRDSGNYGTLTVNHGRRVMKFQSKSNRPDEKEIFGERPLGTFGSMGIYLINRDVMVELLKERFPDENEFGAEVIQGAISIGMKVHAFIFDGYWEDMRTIGAFYQANIGNTKKSNVEFIFFDRDSPVYTLPRCLPPSIISDCVITDSVIGDGCILNRCRIKGTVVGMRTKVEEGAIVEDSVIMGSDTYENAAADMKGFSIPIGIGENTRITKAIVDKNARIGKNVVILNRDNVHEGDNECEGYVIRDGIVVVLQSAAIPDGSIL